MHSHHIIFAAHSYVRGFEKAAYYSSTEKDRPYFITDLLVRFIIDFNVPVPRGKDGQFFKEKEGRLNILNPCHLSKHLSIRLCVMRSLYSKEGIKF